jgi:uncharacterized protein DUF6518
MRGRSIRRYVCVAVAALAFGALESVIKGNGSGVRDGIGNLSAPWVIVPLLAAAAVARRRIVPGAVIGLLTTMTALVGFYLANAFVLDLGAHSTVHDIGLTLDVGNLWFKAGVVSGPVMGAAGAWVRRRGRWAVAASVAGIALFEPLAVYVAYLASNGRFAAGNGEWNSVYGVEAVLGAIAAGVLWRVRLTGRHGSDPSLRA